MSTMPQLAAQTKQKVAQRRHQLMQMRLAGVRDQAQLAKALGVNRSTVSRDLAALTAEFRARANAAVDAEKGLDLERSERVIQALWPKAMAGNARAAEVVLAWVEYRARVLGLAAPTHTRIDLATIDLTTLPDLGGALDRAVEKLRREIAELEASLPRALPPAAIG